MNPSLFVSTLLFSIGSLGLVGCQNVANQSHIDNQTPIVQTSQTDNVPVEDSDDDGVINSKDDCPKTPHHMVVDERGCPYIWEPDVGLKMEYRAFYDEGSSEPSNVYLVELERIAQKMREFKNAKMKIEGHGSIQEEKTGNVASLAQVRAEYIKNYLVLEHDIDPSRINITVYGADRPIAPEDTLEGQKLNQRVYGILTEDSQD